MDMPPDFETLHLGDKTIVFMFSIMCVSYLCICVLLCVLNCVGPFGFLVFWFFYVRVNMTFLIIALINVFIYLCKYCYIHNHENCHTKHKWFCG